MENRKPALWDTLVIRKGGQRVEAVVIHVYESGRIKVRFPSGHLSVVTPDDVLGNYGYRPDPATERVLNMLIKGKWK